VRKEREGGSLALGVDLPQGVHLERRSLLPPSASPSAVAPPLVRRKNLQGTRTAAEQLWGEEGVRVILSLLPPDVLRATGGFVPLDAWLPVAFSVAWFEAVWNGPAGRQTQVFREYVALTIDLGFGRVKKFFLSMATPAMLAERSEKIWRDEFSTGSLKGKMLSPTLATLLLSDHPFAESAVTRIVAAESFRRVVSYTVTTPVREFHTTTAEGLLIRLRWD
jgi:hypothetical protein